MKLLTSLSLLAGLAALSPFASAQIEVATTPVGVVTSDLPSGSTLVAPLFVNGSEFQGASSQVVEDINAGTSTISFDSAAFSSGEFNEAEYPIFYAESIDASGANEGFGYDIISNDASSITVAGLLSDVGFPAGQVFNIRAHLTLGQFFEDSEGLSLTDRAKFFLSDGTSEVYLWNGSQWSNDGNVKPIYPGTGFIVILKSPVTVTSSGTVKDTITQIPLFKTFGAVNLISSGSPVDSTLGELALAESVGLTGSVKFLAESTLANDGVFVSNGSSFSSGGNDVVVFAGEGVVVNVKSSSNYVAIPAAY